MIGIKVDIAECLPEIRVMSLLFPLDAAPGNYEKEYLLIFLYITCSSLKLQNLGVFFEGL